MQIFQKSGSRLKILGAQSVTRSTFHTENSKMLGCTVQNLVARDLCKFGCRETKLCIDLLIANSKNSVTSTDILYDILLYHIYIDGYKVGLCHHGMARPQVADRGTACDKEGSCE